MIIDSPIVSGSLLLTGSLTHVGDAAHTGSFNLSGSLSTIGTITATTLVVQTITSSISSITGSTKFGSIIGNTHQFTGSLLVTGSSTFSGSITAVRGYMNSTDGDYAFFVNGGTGTGNSYGLRVNAGTNGSDYAIRVKNAAQTSDLFTLLGTGAATFSSSVQIGTAVTNYGTLQTFSGYTSPSLTVGTAAAAIFSCSAGQELALTMNGTAPYGINFQARNNTGGGPSGTSYPIIFNPLGGNVGIGTSSPQSIVHASVNNATAPTSGTTPSGYGLSFGSGDGYNGGIWFSSDFGGDQGIAGIAASRVSGYTTDLRFYTNSTNSARAFTERMRIQSSGNLRIYAPSNSDANLTTWKNNQTTFGALSAAGIMIDYAPSTTNVGALAQISFGLQNVYAAAAIAAICTSSAGYSNADLIFGTRSATTDTAPIERMRIKAGGYIDLNNVVYNDTMTSPRTLYIQSNGTIGGISSIRASKKNIENVSNIDWLYQLNPVTFNYRKKDENRNYTEEIYDEITYGLIAEDTQPIAEFLINYDDSNSDKKIIGIEYMKLITPMLKAIQELNTKFEEYKATHP